MRVISLDAPVAEYYAAIVAALKHAGTPIPTNDVWIAALAQYYHLPLYTRDAHFVHVPNLERISEQL